MKVYRIEHRKHKKKGAKCFIGPYGVSGYFSCTDWSNRSHSYETHPCPTNDLKLKESLEERDLIDEWEYRFHCGFISMKQLEEWFVRYERRNLSEMGFVLACYEAKELVEGSQQILFVPKGRRKILSLVD